MGPKGCYDPVKTCSGVNLERVEHDEYGLGRRDQTLDDQAQEHVGHEILQGKTTVAEASRGFALPPSGVEGKVENTKRGMENALRTNPPED